MGSLTKWKIEKLEVTEIEATFDKALRRHL